MSWIQEFLTEESEAAFPHIMASLKSKMGASSLFEPQLMKRVFEYTLFNEEEHSVFEAARKGHLRVIKYLMEGFNVNSFGEFPICWASEHGHLHIVKYLVEKGISQSFKERALPWACKLGRLDIVKFLVEENNLDVNVDDGASIEAACEMGHLEVVKFLVQRGASPNGAWGDGILVWLAAREGHMKTLKFLVEEANADLRRQGTASLWHACKKGKAEIAEYFLSKGIDVHSGDDAAICWASYGGHLEIVKMLVARGASVRAQGSYPARIARERNHTETFQYLLENGARYY